MSKFSGLTIDRQFCSTAPQEAGMARARLGQRVEASPLARNATTISLRGREPRTYGVRPVRTVPGAVAVPPFPDRQEAHVVALGQFLLRERRVADLFPDQVCVVLTYLRRAWVMPLAMGDGNQTCTQQAPGLEVWQKADRNMINNFQKYNTIRTNNLFKKIIAA